MSGQSGGGAGSDSLIDIFMERALYTLDYALTLQSAHYLASFGTAVIGGAVVAIASKLFKDRGGVDSESVVEAETYYEHSGEINPETGNEFINQVIHTHSTYNLRDVFAEATINPDKLIHLVKKAAVFCDKENPIVWSQLDNVMKEKSGLFKWMPEKLAQKFGRYSESEKKKTINEMARCVRNFRSEQLTPKSIRRDQIDPNKRERYIYEKDMSVLAFQEGASADVFTWMKISSGLLNYSLPDPADTRFIYYDYEQPVAGLSNHLHERVRDISAIQRAIKEDAKKENSLLDKFFTRYMTGERKAVPQLNR